MSERRLDSNERLVKLGTLRHETHRVSSCSPSVYVIEERRNIASEMLCALRDFSDIYIDFFLIPT